MYLNLNTGMIGVSASLQDCVRMATEHGFVGIDFSMEEAADLVEQRGIGHVRSIFDAAGVRPGAWGMPVNFRQDEAAWRAGLAGLPRLVEAAAAQAVTPQHPRPGTARVR